MAEVYLDTLETAAREAGTARAMATIYEQLGNKARLAVWADEAAVWERRVNGLVAEERLKTTARIEANTLANAAFAGTFTDIMATA